MSASIIIESTPSSRYSVGVRSEFFRDKEWFFQGGQCNFLLKRWNKPRSQANVYLKSAGGIAYTDDNNFDSEFEPAVILSSAADWEDRRFFIGYENKCIYANKIQRTYTQKVRLGIAPYIGNFNDIHTWFMVDFSHKVDRGNKPDFLVTPLIRYFKGSVMSEIGVSHEGDLLLTWRMLF